MRRVNGYAGDVGLAYHRLRAALSRFKTAPSELGTSERAAIEQIARREHALEAGVLDTPEAPDVTVPDAVVEAAMAQVRARYASADALDEDLARNGMTSETLREALRRELRVEAVLDRVGSRAAEVSEVDAQIYYYSHPEKFREPETRSARHILITVNPRFPENSPAAARKRLEHIARRVLHKPARFAEQAMKHSECPTAVQRGVLGRVARGTLYPALDEVLFSLQEGQVSEVVASELGFHLIYCEQIHPAGLVPLHVAVPRIRDKLQEQRRRICQKSWLANVLKGSPGAQGEKYEA